MTTDHFPISELVFSDTAKRLGIDNTPPEHELDAMRTYLQPGLEKMRTLLGDNPVITLSGFRSVLLNSNVPGSSNTSAHTKGYAADVRCPEFGTPWEICNYLAQSNLVFDQIIYEYASWVHISFDPRLRRLCTTKLQGQPYRAGFHQV